MALNLQKPPAGSAKKARAPLRDPLPRSWHSGAVGAGLVLVVLPSVTLVWGIKDLAGEPQVGLPVLAIFGIMILLGAFALMTSLFSGLGLASRTEALGLPAGSIRAAIALALIVLFALISVMLFQSLSSTRTLDDVSQADKDKFLADPLMHISSATPVPCPPAKPAAAAPASATSTAAPAASAAECVGYRYKLQFEAAPSAMAVDIAKQLLTLIGTLMTSVVSFYFAAKASESALKAATQTPETATDDDAHKTDEPPKLPDMPPTRDVPAAAT